MPLTIEMLQSTLGDTAYDALGVLAASPTPLYRANRSATALRVAPTTATAALGRPATPVLPCPVGRDEQTAGIRTRTTQWFVRG